jgi:hypothetical protein
MKLMKIAVVVIVLAGSLAFAQGSGSTGGSADSRDEFKVTRSLEGKVTQVKAEDNVIVIQDNNGERHNFHFTDQTEITSSKNETGSKSLKVSALKAGEKVKVVFRASDSHAVKLRLLD